MKKINIILIVSWFLLSLSVGAEELISENSSLSMGFYYPSLSNISNKTDIQVSLNYWVAELTNKLGFKNVSSHIFDDTASLKSAFDTGKIDMVIAPPLLISMFFDKKLLYDGFVGVQVTHKRDNLLIISRDDSDNKNAHFLKKRLLLPKNDLFAKYFIDAEVIKKHHKSSQQVFSQIKEMTKNQRIILALFFNKADVGVVYESALEIMTELNPQIATRVNVLKKFPIKSRNYAYFHRDFPYKEQLRARAHEFSSQTRGKQILEVFHATDIDNCYIADLQPFEDFYKNYQQLKKAQNDSEI